MTLQFDETGHASIGGAVRCYYFEEITGEYTGYSDEYINVGVSLPACAYIDEPPAYEAGKAIIRVGDKWELIDDHRGETVYSTENGQPVEVKALGDYPENTTPLAPGTPQDKWNDYSWVTDETKLKAANIADAEFRKAQLRAQADSEITWRLDAVDAGIATEQEETELASWKKYRVLLMRIDTSKATGIEWPEPPVA